MRSDYQMGARRELLGEGFLVQPISGDCRFQVGRLERREVVLDMNQPGEYSNWGGYPHLVDLGNGTWRLYYIAGTMLEPGKATHRHDFFVAETRDGIHFERVPIQDSKVGTNCVICHEDTDPLKLYSSTCFVFRDTNPAIKKEEQFKLLMLGENEDGMSDSLFLFCSPDGLKFDLQQRTRLALEGDFDSLNTCFYSPEIQRYRIFFRTRNFGVRTIRTAVTADFKIFECQADLMYGDGEEMSLYTNSISPYFRAPHIQVGFPMRYSDNQQIWDERVMARPGLEARANWAIKGKCVRLGTAVTDGIVIMGRDGYHFTRYGEAILRPGPCREGSWNYGDNNIAVGMIPTASSYGYGAPDELSVYAEENADASTGTTRIRRYSMRMDGMASLHFGWKKGEAMSRPFVFEGNALTLNLSTSGAGNVAVEISDAETHLPVAGYSLDDCYAVNGDSLDAVVFWKDGADLSSLAGRSVQLRFVGQDADLYSLKFEKLDSFPVLPELPSNLPIQPVFRYVK